MSVEVGSKWRNKIDGGADPESYVEVVTPIFDDSVSFVRRWTIPGMVENFRVSLFHDTFIEAFYRIDPATPPD